MQKKIIALAVAGLSTAAFAQTNVTIYGVADVSYQGQNISQSRGLTTNPSGAVSGIKSNSSLIGFKGTEDLGNGLKGLFQIETGVNMNGNNSNGQIAVGSTSNSFGAARDSYVGLSNKYGTVLGGFLSTPYRSTLTSFDVFPGATGSGRIETLVGRVTMGAQGTGGATAYNNTASYRATAIAYAMPTLYGFNGSIAYTGNTNNSNTNPQTGNPNSGFSFNLGWDGYGVGVKGAFIQTHNTNTYIGSTTAGLGVNNTTAYLIGAQYTGLPGLKAGVVYGRNTIGTATSAGAAGSGSQKLSNNNIWVGASYRFGNNEPRISYANASNTSGQQDTATFGGQNGATQWNLGWGYYLSKRTQVYGILSQISNRANGVTNFADPTGATLTGGQKLVTYGAGLRTNF